MAAPCVLLTSCSESFDISELARQILSVESLPSSTPRGIESIFSYPWMVDTKYYTANVELCTTAARTIGDQEFADCVEAFVAYFDCTQAGSFDRVKFWLPYLREMSPSVQILVCDRFHKNNDVISRTAALTWCLDSSFELVELNPAESDSDNEADDDEDDFKETVGVKRIIEALSCHSWSNMVLKDKPSYRSPFFQQLMTDTAILNKSEKTESQISTAAPSESYSTDTPAATSVDHHDQKLDQTESVLHAQATQISESANAEKSSWNATEKSSKSSSEIIDGMLGSLASTDDENDSFEKLFENLQFMKESAVNMPADERKKYAEQVTLQFWRAIGGNPDEIDGLSDECDENDDETEDRGVI